MQGNTNGARNKTKGSEGHACQKKHGAGQKLLVCVGGKVFGIKDIFKDGKK